MPYCCPLVLPPIRSCLNCELLREVFIYVEVVWKIRMLLHRAVYLSRDAALAIDKHMKILLNALQIQAVIVIPGNIRAQKLQALRTSQRCNFTFKNCLPLLWWHVV